MPLFVGATVLDVLDLDRAIAFWSDALGYRTRSRSATFAVLTDPRRRWSNVSLQLATEPKRDVNRVHLDLYSGNQDADVRRLLALGARRAAWEHPPDADYVVLEDPDGNEFCVVQSPWTQDGGPGAA